jgi:transposase
MTPYREILRLHSRGISQRDIAASCQCSRNTITRVVTRAKELSLAWPLKEDLTDGDLEKTFFPDFAKPSSSHRMPELENIHQEMVKPGVTLRLLWTEYCTICRLGNDQPLMYSQFCYHYQKYAEKKRATMHIPRKPGEQIEVDWAGQTAEIINDETGEIMPAYIFVAALSYSQYAYVEAFWAQNLECWIAAHVNMYRYFGGVSKILVPDNLKSGVNKACKYEPELNPTYSDMAEHYGCAVLPARPRKPRDKAKVENGVLIAKRWILAVLRHRTFHSLAELNAAIRECLERLNTRPMRQAKKSRRELFEEVDRPNALPLPPRPYEYAEWYKAKVQLNYHVEVDGHYYSVPHQLLHERLDVRLTAAVVEAFYKGERVAAHARLYAKGAYTTLKEHMPPSHRYYAEWNPARFIQWAGKTGEATARLVETVLASRPYPEQGIINLTRDYEPVRVEAAARRALKFKTCSYRSMKAILSAGLDRQPDNGEQPRLPGLPPHQNIRGQEYYR